MLDFLRISQRHTKSGIEVYPNFKVIKTKDLMIRGSSFYAIWVEEKNLWSTDEFEAIKMIDDAVHDYAEELRKKSDESIKVLYLWDSESGAIDRWHKYTQQQMHDNYVPLDEKLIFSNHKVTREDYASKVLPYPLEPCDTPSYDKLMSTLYSEEERHKIEWAIGAVVSGDSKEIQKFLVLYGAGGTGKSTVLNIIAALFEGYTCTFSAKALGSANGSFAMEPFRDNPLVAIDNDGKLDKIEDNTRINTLVAHEMMTVNEKFKSTYSARFKCFLFIATNTPVKITDSRSGLIRRLIDVSPTGNTLSRREYNAAIKHVYFELGGIAYHCLDVYKEDPSYYDDYIPSLMIGATNDFYNFIEDNIFDLEDFDGISLKSAWELYKAYCADANIPYPMKRTVFKEELKNYYEEFFERYQDPESNERYRSYYKGFLKEKMAIGNDRKKPKEKKPARLWLMFKEQESLFDKKMADCPAQYLMDDGSGRLKNKWEKCPTKLSDLDTSILHHVKVMDIHHIVIDFDLCDEQGNKSLELNLAEANKWPSTYAELSKSGQGIHLHYIYTGDPSMLNRVVKEHVEIKVFTGNMSLRRKLTMCNDIPIRTISSGLPLKGEAKVISSNNLKDEKHLRVMINKNLRKEFHDNTTESVNYIYQLLEDAYNDEKFTYDVTDMRNTVTAFAAGSTHQSAANVKKVTEMHFKSKEPAESIKDHNADIVFYDVEVFPNLFVVCWKFRGTKDVVKMINPSPKDISDLLQYNLVGFNCRRYDNHIIYARMQGYDNEMLYKLSQNIINSKKNDGSVFFGNAYNLSYTDIYDFCSKKQSLKKWEIELGIHHQEWNHPWDEPVPEELWDKVAEYCANDVIATEAVFEARQSDFQAREILSDISNIRGIKASVNDTTNNLTTKIIFGNDKNPELKYTHLEEKYPGYEFVLSEDDHKFHNMYRGTDLGFGGYVYGKEGMYTDVALLDIASMHPTSIVMLDLFGKYTKNFADLLQARIYIKHGEYNKAGELFDGALKPYLKDKSSAKALAQALKIAINSVYGLTSAGFNNPFKDKNNVNNIVALSGALFMKTLQDEVTARGYTVVHIKTDSIKIANADQEIIDFCMDFAQKYGYTFEHEATYTKICLVNKSTYIAKDASDGHWTATGDQFKVPYVFKTLFSKEPLTFEDMCMTFEVTKGSLYLDQNENLPDVRAYETELDKRNRGLKRLNKDLEGMSNEELEERIKEGHNYIFVGKVGQFTPVTEGCNSGVLYSKSNTTGKFNAAAKTKGYRWKESELIREFGGEEFIDKRYFDNLVNDAIKAIDEYGDFEWFATDDNEGMPMPKRRDLTDEDYRDYIQF